jgi:hypothetical protein
VQQIAQRYSFNPSPTQVDTPDNTLQLAYNHIEAF